MTEEDTYIDEPGETVQGLYNLRSSSLYNPGSRNAFNLGGRHSYDYVPQYAVRAAEEQIRQHYEPGTATQTPTARGAQLTLTGPAVHNLIVAEYRAKGYTPEHAARIARRSCR